MKPYLVGTTAVFSLLVGRILLADPPSAEPADKPLPDRAELEKRFTETMSEATLIGRFTVDGQKADQPLKEDRYTLGRVSKLKGDYWFLPARVQYGDHDLQLPLALQVKWAGDTPVITLTDLTVPGLGTFTARVLIYDGAYAGTWSAGDHRGQMFGRVVQGDASSAANGGASHRKKNGAEDVNGAAD